MDEEITIQEFGEILQLCPLVTIRDVMEDFFSYYIFADYYYPSLISFDSLEGNIRLVLSKIKCVKLQTNKFYAKGEIYVESAKPHTEDKILKSIISPLVYLSNCQPILEKARERMNEINFLEDIPYEPYTHPINEIKPITSYSRKLEL